MASVSIHLDEGLSPLLYRRLAGENPIHYSLDRKASVKDVLESCGIPHTEIGKIRINSRDVSFSSIIEENDRIDVFGLNPPVDVLSDTHLRSGLSAVRFAVDVNVGKLASLLRMVGLDTFFEPELSDGKLAEVCEQEERILLTRDRVLLMRKTIEHGRFIRHLKAEDQLAEVMDLYGLHNIMQPFSRCLVCNDELEAVEKEDIHHRLEPLTKKYYHTFRMCRACDKIYWAGSHKERMKRLLHTISQRI